MNLLINFGMLLGWLIMVGWVAACVVYIIKSFRRVQ